MERLWKPEGDNILKGQVVAEWVEWGHMAAENTGEPQRMIGKKFYVIYYTFVDNKNLLQQILWILHFSCVYTLAQKLRLSIKGIFRKYGAQIIEKNVLTHL